jgi:hypothetical protein
MYPYHIKVLNKNCICKNVIQTYDGNYMNINYCLEYNFVTHCSNSDRSIPEVIEKNI